MMASEVISTSQWIAFFRKAGLPSNVAANYAIIFSDNRIQLDMLLDLSKEYLYDMGIKVMGDVIAILKYAKEFNSQLVKERMIGNPNSMSNKAVAERIMGHYTRPVTRSPVQTTQASQKTPNVISLKKEATHATSVKRIRRVPPEEEGSYKIKMPSGTTERTRKILQMQQKKFQGQKIQLTKRSVFTRLGESAVSSSTDFTKTPSSVFERLGPSNKALVTPHDETPTSTVIERPVVPLQYKGVLKITSGKKRTVLAATPVTNPLMRTVVQPQRMRKPNLVKTIKTSQINRIQNLIDGSKILPLKRTVKQTSAQGIFDARMQNTNIKSRLGNKINTRNMTRTKILLKASSKNNVFDRLG